MTMDDTQQVQENQYEIPYHYIPRLNHGGFSQAVSWSWGMRYMAGLETILAQLENVKFESIIDIGCGDGRFLREVGQRFTDKRILGIDYSSRAIALAKAMNPTLDYRCINILDTPVDERFDVATMVEVLEHIPPEQVNDFLRSTKAILRTSGLLVLTVPHVNKTVSNKHYQHFSSDTLYRILAPHFRVKRIVPFDRLSRLTNWLTRLLGSAERSYVITNRYLNSYLYHRVLRGCLEVQPERHCGRLLAIATVEE